jgi:hypothetical protein
MIAYVVLYGVVMSLLATLVFVIVKAARKINSQSILNRGASILYTEFLSQIVTLNPDTVSDVAISEDGNTISIEFEKKYKYNDEGKRVEIEADDAEYSYKPIKIKYIYTKGSDNINVVFTNLAGTNSYSTISLDFGMTLTSVNSTEITDVFKVDKQNSTNKYVTVHGNLHFDDKKLEINYIIPVFVIRGDE